VDTTYSLAGPVRGASGGKVGEVLISPRALKPR
jgi:hypothetical protein